MYTADQALILVDDCWSNMMGTLPGGFVKDIKLYPGYLYSLPYGFNNLLFVKLSHEVQPSLHTLWVCLFLAFTGFILLF